MKKNITRQSNIELLRIIAIMGVVLLHYNNDTMGGAFSLTLNMPINHTVCLIFEAIAIGGVNIFILISGYFLIDSDVRKVSKVIELIFQLVLFKVIIYTVDSLIYGNFTWKDFGFSFVPNNYFVIIYIALYLVSPLINGGFKKLSNKTKSIFLIICIVIFSGWTYMVDAFNCVTNVNWEGLSTISIDGSSGGYTIINFMLMYLIGAYLKLFEEKIKINRKELIIAFVLLVGAIVVLSTKTGVAYNYNSPLVIAEAVVTFLLFKKINIGYRKWINTLAKAAFICFLLHKSFLKYIFIDYFTNANTILLILHMIISPIIIYLACWLIYKLYNLIFGKIFQKLSNIACLRIDFSK